MSDEVEITDGDREAAASVAVLAEMRELILSGRADHHAEPWARRRMAGYQAAIADVVEWFAENAKKCSLEVAYSGKPYCPPQWTAQDAIDQITRRFGRGQDQNPVK